MNRKYYESVDFLKVLLLVLIIVLGDVGINYYLDSSDDRVKKKLSKYPCSFFFIQDNKRVN